MIEAFFVLDIQITTLVIKIKTIDWQKLPLIHVKDVVWLSAIGKGRLWQDSGRLYSLFREVANALG